MVHLSCKLAQAVVRPEFLSSLQSPLTRASSTIPRKRVVMECIQTSLRYQQTTYGSSSVEGNGILWPRTHEFVRCVTTASYAVSLNATYSYVLSRRLWSLFVLYGPALLLLGWRHSTRHRTQGLSTEASFAPGREIAERCRVLLAVAGPRRRRGERLYRRMKCIVCPCAG